MKIASLVRRAVHLEQLEQRWLLSTSPGSSIDELLHAPKAPQVVDANTITSIVAAILNGAPVGDPIFMKYEGIDGDVSAEGFDGAIELNSFQWGVGRGIGSPSGGGDREASIPSVSEIVVTKQFDSSSVPLIREAFVGQPADVEIDFVNFEQSGKSQIYLKVELDNTLLSGYSMSSGGDRPTESLSLNFTKITISALDRQGEPQRFTYDLVEQKGTFLTAGTASVPSTSRPSLAATSTDIGVDPIYMKYGDVIRGDVAAKGYEGAIELNSFQWGVGRGIGSPSAGGGREVSAPSVSEIVVTKQFDSSSVPLIQEAFIGKNTDVDVDFVNQFASGLEAYLKVKLENTLISGYSMSSGGDRPSETLSLNFTKVTLDAVDSAGQKQSFTFDLAKGGSSLATAGAAAGTVTRASAPQAPMAAAAGVDPIFMRYGDIVGDATAAGHEGASELNSFQWGVGRSIGSPTGGADREASAPSVSEIVVTKQFDSSSVPLIKEAFVGVNANAKIDFVNQVDGKNRNYFKVELGNTLVSGYSMSSGGDRPSESLSLNFTKISFTAVGIKGERQNFKFDLAKQAASATTSATALARTAAASSSAASATATATAIGADPIFMKYGDIKGDVAAEGFEGATELQSFQWGVGRGISSPTAGGGRQVSAPSVSEIVVTKQFDSSSLPLIREAFVGEDTHVDTDFAIQTEAGFETYLGFDLENTMISGYSMSSGGDRPSESLSLNFTKVTISSVDSAGVPQTFTFDRNQGGSVVTAATPRAAATAGAAASQGSVSASAAVGADPIFMRYGDITGDVTAEDFEGAIELHSFQWGVGRSIGSPTGGGDREASAPSVSEIVVTKQFDSSSVPLIREAFIGEDAHVDADFAVQTETGFETYLGFDLDNTMISGYSMSSGGDRPSESLALNFTKITISALDSAGQKQKFTFDLAKQGASIVTAAIAPAGAAATTTSQGSPSTSGGFGADPIYMKYGDIAGDVTAEGFEGAVELNSFQWGVGRGISSPTAGGGREASAPSVSEIVVTKQFDSSSIPLIREFFTGDDTHVDVDFVNHFEDESQTYLSFDLEDTLISGYSMSSGGDRPFESLSLNFTKITISSNLNGEPQTFTFDLAKGSV